MWSVSDTGHSAAPRRSSPEPGSAARADRLPHTTEGSQTRRAPTPPYQPSRYTRTRYRAAGNALTWKCTAPPGARSAPHTPRSLVLRLPRPSVRASRQGVLTHNRIRHFARQMPVAVNSTQLGCKRQRHSHTRDARRQRRHQHRRFGRHKQPLPHPNTPRECSDNTPLFQLFTTE